MLSFTEENYIKAIYKLSETGDGSVSTNAIAEAMQTKAASVTDMLRRLHEKGIINYVKYRGVTLTETGQRTALQLVRKHRLWEVFLVDKLKHKAGYLPISDRIPGKPAPGLCLPQFLIVRLNFAVTAP